MVNIMQNQIDPTVKALVSAIGETETGVSSPAAYSMRGKSGEFGRYQFMPDTWKSYAAESGISTPLEKSTIEEQNKVAYNKVAKWKQQGYNPAQIASMWNAGEGKPNAYKEGYAGTNTQGVSYDTVDYARKVSDAYNRLKPQTQLITSSNSIPQQENKKKSFFGDVADTVGGAFSGLSTAIGKGVRGEINPFSSVLQGVGSIAGGVTGLVDDTIKHTPIVGDIYEGVTGLIGKGVQKLAETETGQSVVKGINDWSQEHPEAAGNIQAAVDILGAVPILKGVSVTKDAIKSGVSTALHGAEDAVYSAIEPKLGPKALARAIQERGTITKGFLRVTKLANDKFLQKMADTVRTHVSNFKPGRSILKNISETQKVVDTMSKELKNAVEKAAKGRIYPKKELMSILKGIEKPDLIASDATLNNLYNRLISRVDSIATKKGGRVSDLLDLRKEFDEMVRKQYPDLYRNERLTPLRQAVSDIRGAITDFTVKKLPEGMGFKESLQAQHQLIKAIENMSSRVASKASHELGSNALSRFAQRHPLIKGLVKSGGKALMQGTGAGTVMNILD